MRAEDRAVYREGVVLNKPVRESRGSFVNVGLPKVGVLVILPSVLFVLKMHLTYYVLCWNILSVIFFADLEVTSPNPLTYFIAVCINSWISLSLGHMRLKKLDHHRKPL